MSSRVGKLLLVLLIPALLYGAAKGYMYYTAKRTVDRLVTLASDHVDIRYADISTDLRGAVTVSGISMQPLGQDEGGAIDAVRIASDDPMFFLRGGEWVPGETAPPNSLSLHVAGLRMPVSAAMLPTFAASGSAGHDASEPCSNGLSIEPELLKKVGFTEIQTDLDGFYRISEDDRTLEMGIDMDVMDIESTRLSVTLTDVDVEGLARGAAPNLNLGEFSFALRIAPEFGRQAIKACAVGGELTVQEWSDRLADQALAQLQQQGLTLGVGLSATLRQFYREWGEFEVVAKPAQPVGLLSLLFLPPEQLAGALGLQLTLNDQLITDTSFSWERPDGASLAAMLGRDAEQARGERQIAPKRRMVRREYEAVPVGDIASYVDHQVKIKPRGQPVREGLLRRIADGQAEVEQSLHGGKYTVYVPLAGVESMQALIAREISSGR